MKITFVTGNPDKVKYLSQWLEHPLEQRKLDLDEIQSLNVATVAEHKAREAFRLVGQPVLVEDGALHFSALSGVPGPFIKWFEKPGLEALCRMLDGFEDRRATAHLCYCLFDGQTVQFFEGKMHGKIADVPAGTRGFGWDKIFINHGHQVTRGQMSEEAYAETSYRKQAIDKLAEYLNRK